MLHFIKAVPAVNKILDFLAETTVGSLLLLDSLTPAAHVIDFLRFTLAFIKYADRRDSSSPQADARLPSERRVYVRWAGRTPTGGLCKHACVNSL